MHLQRRLGGGIGVHLYANNVTRGMGDASYNYMDNLWHHVVVVRDGANGQFRVDETVFADGSALRQDGDFQRGIAHLVPAGNVPMGSFTNWPGHSVAFPRPPSWWSSYGVLGTSALQSMPATASSCASSSTPRTATSSKA